MSTGTSVSVKRLVGLDELGAHQTRQQTHDAIRCLPRSVAASGHRVDAVPADARRAGEQTAPGAAGRRTSDDESGAPCRAATGGVRRASLAAGAVALAVQHAQGRIMPIEARRVHQAHIAAARSPARRLLRTASAAVQWMHGRTKNGPLRTRTKADISHHGDRSFADWLGKPITSISRDACLTLCPSVESRTYAREPRLRHPAGVVQLQSKEQRSVGASPDGMNCTLGPPGGRRALAVDRECLGTVVALAAVFFDNSLHRQ
jgi:hypothetical protein